MYFGQQGVKRSLKKSFELFEAAFKNNEHQDPSIDYSVGIMKFKGEGTKQDIEEARKIFEKSISKSGEENNPAALVGLAVYHLDQTKDVEKAISLLTKAARLGNPDAKHNLALLNLEVIPNQPILNRNKYLRIKCQIFQRMISMLSINFYKQHKWVTLNQHFI